MIQHIYRTKSLDRQLNRMRHSGKKGALAVRQTEEIIDELCSCGDPFQVLKRKQIKNRELRLINCRKYDLGAGYRLIAIQDKDCLILAYAGSHDECHLWLENHRNTLLNASSFKNSSTIIHAAYSLPQPEESSPITDSTPDSDPYEEDLLGRIDEKTLRYVFSGLYQSK